MSSTTERRRFERVSFFADAEVTATGLAPKIACRTVDISLGGVGLACPSLIPVDQIVRVGFRLKEPGGSVAVEEVVGRVRNARWEDGACLLGVEFLDPVTKQMAPRLVAALERI